MKFSHKKMVLFVNGILFSSNALFAIPDMTCSLHHRLRTSGSKASKLTSQQDVVVTDKESTVVVKNFSVKLHLKEINPMGGFGPIIHTGIYRLNVNIENSSSSSHLSTSLSRSGEYARYSTGLSVGEENLLINCDQNYPHH